MKKETKSGIVWTVFFIFLIPLLVYVGLRIWTTYEINSLTRPTEQMLVFREGDINDVREYLEKSDRGLILDNFYSLIRRGRSDILEMILKEYRYKADLNSAELGLPSPLFLASEIGQLDVIKVLIKYGADLNYRNSYSMTPLIAAAYSDRPQRFNVIKLLVEAGADVNAESEFGRNAIAGALFGSDNLNIVNYLIQNGANPNKLNKGGSNYMFYCDTVECIRYFVDLGLDINGLNNTGINLIQSSALSRFKTKSEIKQLLELGVDICHIDNNGYSVLKHMDESGLFPQNIKEQSDFYNKRVKKNRQTEVYQYLEQEYQQHCLSEAELPATTNSE